MGDMMLQGLPFINRQSREWAALIGQPLKGTVYASDFGVRGDGVTDDTRALQQALNSVETGGGRLVIPRGRYKITAALTITNDSDGGITIEGEGSQDYSLNGGTQIESSASSGNIFTIDGNSSPAYITFRNIALIGNANLDNGVKISRASNWRFDGVVIKGCSKSSGSGANAVYLTYTSGGEFTGVGFFTDCVFYSNYRGVYADKNDINALTFHRCQFSAGTFGYVNGSTSIAVNQRTVDFIGCIFEGNSDVDVYSGGGAIGWNVLGCYFEWTGNKIPIKLEGSASSPINNAIAVIGNVFSGDLADNTGFVTLGGNTDGLTFKSNFGGGTYTSSKYCVYQSAVTVDAYDIQVIGVASGGTKPSVTNIGAAIPASFVSVVDRGTPFLANSIGSDVALNNTANFFDGPSVAQGTIGTWFASGTVTLNDTGGAAVMFAKLWDGTNVISSAEIRIDGAGEIKTVSLSGFITGPAGNIRISVRDATNTTGVIIFNATGTSKDSTVTAVRIT